MKRTLLMAMGLVVALYGWRTLSSGEDPGEAHSRSRGGLAPEAPSPQRLPPLSCWASAEAVYDVWLSSRFTFSSPVGEGPVSRGTSEWSGELHVEPESAGRSRIVLRRVSVASGDASEVLQRMEAPAGVEVDATCRFVRFHFSEDLPPAARDQWKLVLSLAELIRPEGDEAAMTWTRRQEDPTGVAVVQYERPATDTVVREKRGYETLATHVDGIRVSAHIQLSRTTARLTVDGRLGSLEGVEELSLGSDGQERPFAEARTRFSWTLRDGARPELSTRVATTRASEGMMLTQRRTEHFDPFAGQLPSTLEEAKALFEAELERAGLRAALGVMVPFLRAHQEAAFELLAELRNETFSDAAQRHAFLALELADTPSARAALGSALQDASFTTRDRLRAAAALPDAGDPAETLSALRAARFDGDREVATASTLALGATARRSDLPEAERRRVREELEQALTTAQAVDDRVVAMEALTNSRDPAVSRHLDGFLEDAEPLLRAAAAEGLRTLGTDLEIERVLGLLERERSIPALRALSELLAARTGDGGTRALEVVERRLFGGDPLPTSVAKPLIRFLGAQGRFYPEQVQRVLSAVVMGYRDRDIRQWAARYL